MHKNARVAVLAPDGEPLMPMRYERAEVKVAEGKAEWVSNDLQIKQIRLLVEPSGRATQPIAVGIDSGKDFAGIAAVSSKAVLFTAHVILPRAFVTQKMSARRLLRRTRRGRRIDRKVVFHLRARRQKRFDNRKQSKLVPSVKASKLLELRIVQELKQLFPVSCIVYELIKATTENGKGKRFSPAMVGQRKMLEWLAEIASVRTLEGWQTAILRQQLGLVKSKDKGEQTPQSHAVDGIALAASTFMQYESFQTKTEHGHRWVGTVRLTPAPFRVIARPKLYRRQLHFENLAKGGVRKRKGGTVSPFGFRSGDLVRAEKAGKVVVGWIGGWSEVNKVVSVYSYEWKRIGQFGVSKVKLLRRSNKLCIA